MTTLRKVVVEVNDSIYAVCEYCEHKWWWDDVPLTGKLRQAYLAVANRILEKHACKKESK